jgi:hypothetical protein
MIDNADADRERAAHDLGICLLALVGSQFLGIVDAGEGMAGGQNNRRGYNRTSQWTATGFIDAGYIPVTFAVKNAFRRAVSGKHFRMRMPGRSCPVQ